MKVKCRIGPGLSTNAKKERY